MIAHLQIRKYPVSRTRVVRRFQALAFTVFLSWFVSVASAQFFWDYYERDTYHPLIPYKAGTLGTLFNSAPLLIKQATTTYNVKQDVYVLAYLPFVEQEYSIFAENSLELFGPNYKTAVALASPRDPALGLYAPVQVSAMDSSLTEPNTVARYPFASIIPYGTDPNTFNGPFNTLATANTQDPAFIHPTPGEYGISVLAAAQKFTKFSHELLTDKNGVGWDGFDKAGENTVKFVVVQSNIPGYEKTQMIPNSGGVVEIVINKLPSAQIATSQTVIGHEITHGIVHHAIGTEMVLFKSQSFRELDEGFCLIIGHSFRLWMRPEQFSVPDWEYWRETIPVGSKGYLIDKPKLNGLPNTFQGAYYDYSPGHPSYDVHDNGAVMGFWFYLLNSTTSGYVDDKPGNDEYYVQPLIPGDKEGTYKLALRILFNAFTTKLNHEAGYPELRQATLETAIELGYNSSSHVYKQLMSAWGAVGVDEPEYNVSCTTASAESLHNGPVTFNASESTLTPDPGSQKINKLLDCFGPDTIATLFNSNDKAYIADDNGDAIYSGTDNQFESKVAVSVHKFSQVSRDWYKAKLGWNGMDGSGQFRINNVIGANPGAMSIIIHGTHSAQFVYPYKAISACRDEISRVYFSAVADFVKFSAPPDKPYHSEWAIIQTSIGQIFSLETKKDYERANQNPDAETIWTIFEDSDDQSLLRNFENPKLNGQPAVYHGANWSNTNPEHNSGFLNLFYYLLVHGTKDDNGQDVGYTNDEPGSKTYFVNKMDREMVLRVLWDAYRALSYHASVEEFRQATMNALHANPDHGPKSKQHIAFHDAWAAVLGLADYASSLALYPAEGTNVYPWPVKVGAEAEYPLYESYRLFEVSKSSTFNESEHPVHRFVNGVMQINMDTNTDAVTYGEVNLEPGQTYWVRSHQADGPGARAHCATTDDPAFCESLLTKKKWTLPYSFKAEAVPAVVNLSPANGETVPAWSSLFSFGSTPGAAGYDMAVIDGSGTVSEQLVAINSPYDYEEPEQSQVIETTLALSKEKPYTYRVAPRQKLGSGYAVHVLPNGLIYPFTEAEKEAFPDVYGDWTGDISIKTDLPSIELQSPADGAKVPLFGSPIDLKAQEELPKRADFYKLSIREPLMQEDLINPVRTVYGTQLAGLADQKEYKWTITPAKKAQLPFIPEDEIGAIPDWFHFIVDKEKVPAPVVTSPGNQCVAAGKKVVVTWEAVPGAKGYEYAIIDLATNQDIARDIVVGQTESPPISGATVYPKQYKQVVRAGIQDPNGNWVFGKEGTTTYTIRPETPSNFTPQGPTISLGTNNSIHFGWEDALSTGAYQFILRKHDPETNTSQTIVDTDFSGTDILVEDLEFDTEYQRNVHVVSANGCTSAALTSTFVTEPEPVTMDPELRFKFQMFCSDVLGWGILDPFIKYNLVIHDPDGNKVFSEMGLSSVISVLDEKLPVVDGVYTANIIITEVDPVYTETDEPEGSVIMMLDLFNIANADKKLLDSDLLGGKFDPVKNLMLNLAFEVDTDNFTLSHRGNAETGGQPAKKVVKIVSFKAKYPELELTLFPNPASSEVQIMPGLSRKGKQYPLQVIDQQGRQVLSRNWAGEKLDVSSLQEGIYIVKVQRGELIFSQKLVIRK